MTDPPQDLANAVAASVNAVLEARSGPPSTWDQVRAWLPTIAMFIGAVGFLFAIQGDNTLHAAALKRVEARLAALELEMKRSSEVGVRLKVLEHQAANMHEALATRTANRWTASQARGERDRVDALMAALSARLDALQQRCTAARR